jgi:phage shock protein E
VYTPKSAFKEKTSLFCAQENFFIGYIKMNWNLLIVGALLFYIGYSFILPRITAGKEDFNPEVSYQLAKKGALIIDVRSAQEYSSGHVEGAENIAHNEIISKKNELITLTQNDLSKTIIVYCASGKRSALAKKDLQSLGYTHVVNHGGFSSWKK